MALTSAFADLRVAIRYRVYPTATLDQVRAEPELLRRIVTPGTDLGQIPDLRLPERHHPPRINTKGLPATYTGKLYGRESELERLFADLETPKPGWWLTMRWAARERPR